jgi:hypothetical protein
MIFLLDKRFMRGEESTRVRNEGMTQIDENEGLGRGLGGALTNFDYHRNELQIVEDKADPPATTTNN